MWGSVIGILYVSYNILLQVSDIPSPRIFSKDIIVELVPSAWEFFVLLFYMSNFSIFILSVIVTHLVVPSSMIIETWIEFILQLYLFLKKDAKFLKDLWMSSIHISCFISLHLVVFPSILAAFAQSHKCSVWSSFLLKTSLWLHSVYFLLSALGCEHVESLESILK